MDRTFLVAQTVKRLLAMWETRVLIPGLGRSPGEGNSNPLQYSCLENPMDSQVRHDLVAKCAVASGVSDSLRPHGL